MTKKRDVFVKKTRFVTKKRDVFYKKVRFVTKKRDVFDKKTRFVTKKRDVFNKKARFEFPFKVMRKRLKRVKNSSTKGGREIEKRSSLCGKETKS